MKVKTGFLLGYSVTAILFGYLGFTILRSYSQINTKIYVMHQTKISSLLLIDDMYEEMMESIPDVYSYTTLGNPTNKEGFNEKMEEYAKKENDYRQIVKNSPDGIDPRESDYLNQLNQNHQEFVKAANGLFANYDKNHKIDDSDYSNLNTISYAVHDSLDALLTLRREKLELASSNIEQMIRYTIKTVIIIAVIVGTIAGSIALLMLRSITKPIKLLRDAVDSIARGNLSQRAPVIGKNEISTLAINFNNMAEKIEGAHGKISKVDQQLQEKNKTLESQDDKLKQQLDQLQKFKNVTADRELEVVELKKKIEELTRNKENNK